MKNRILIQAWNLYKIDNQYYIEYTHYVYLTEIRNYYAEIFLISPTKNISESEIGSKVNLSKLKCNIFIEELPFISSYISAYNFFFYYLKAYNKLNGIRFDLVYSRFPSPFGWLQKLYFKNDRVIHFVGDPIDTLLVNKKINKFIKFIKIFFFIPEFLLFIFACYGRNVKVYTNGHHLANKLKKYNIEAIPLISTTLVDSDFYSDKRITNRNNISLVYVGYLRKAKGVEVILEALKLLKLDIKKTYDLTVVGTGEEEIKLRNFVRENNLQVKFLGHIDDREELNKILRNSDIFCFASLSEGSPRVILEAMANSLPIISTPVGSLPHIFEDKRDIIYFNFNDHNMLADKIIELSNNIDLREMLSKNSFKKAKSYRLTKFIKEVFSA